MNLRRLMESCQSNRSPTRGSPPVDEAEPATALSLTGRIRPPGPHVAAVYAVTTDAFMCRAV
jgi:hypothetical protein